MDDLRLKIDQHGWAVRSVVDDDPALCFAYTVGLSGHDHPEVVMTGLPSDAAIAFLNLVGQLVVREGGQLQAGVPTGELSDGILMPVIEVTDKSGLTAVAEIYGDVPALQVVWTDSHGRLPWASGYANPSGSQPLLGPNA